MNYKKKIKIIRSDFFFLKNLINGKKIIYLDNAATTQKPICVINSINSYYKFFCSNINRGSNFLSDFCYKKIELSRESVKNFINAKTYKEIIFTSGSTEAVSLLSNFFNEFLKDGDNIIISDFEHHSNIAPWHLLCKNKNVFIRFINSNICGNIFKEKFNECFDKKTKLVIISHVSNSLGYIIPIEYITKETHSNGSYLILDCSQSVAHLKIDVSLLNIDFLFFSSHKIYSATGVGVLYIRNDLNINRHFFKLGGGSINSLYFNKILLKRVPYKNESGTQNISNIFCLSSALEYLKNIGFDFISYHNNLLMTRLFNELSNFNFIKILGNNIESKIGLLSFSLNNIHPHDFSNLASREGIIIRTGLLCAQPIINKFNLNSVIRISLALYNNEKEIEIFIDFIKNKVYKKYAK